MDLGPRWSEEIFEICMESKIVFGNEHIKKEFQKLEKDDPKLYSSLKRAFVKLEHDAFFGTQIPKRLIPPEYQRKFGRIDNLWKFDLPKAWRLIYTVKSNDVVILSIVLEWFDHKDYEKRFRY